MSRYVYVRDTRFRWGDEDVRLLDAIKPGAGDAIRSEQQRMELEGTRVGQKQGDSRGTRLLLVDLTFFSLRTGLENSPGQRASGDERQAWGHELLRCMDLLLMHCAGYISEHSATLAAHHWGIFPGPSSDMKSERTRVVTRLRSQVESLKQAFVVPLRSGSGARGFVPIPKPAEDQQAEYYQLQNYLRNSYQRNARGTDAFQALTRLARR